LEHIRELDELCCLRTGVNMIVYHQMLARGGQDKNCATEIGRHMDGSPLKVLSLKRFALAVPHNLGRPPRR
jgi:hypothetical protein